MYRTSPTGVNYWTVAQKLMGHRVVIWLPDEGRWKRGFLVGLIPGDDLFQIKWRRKGFGRTLKGIWRVHSSELFEGTHLLPTPRYPARVPDLPTNPTEGVEVPPAKRATKKVVPPKARSTKKAPSSDEDNGAKRARVDKLGGLSEAKRRNIAKLIYRERSKSPSTSWPDIIELVLDKYDWTLPGSMTGRRLLREYGPDEAEDAIIKQDRSAAKTKAVKKAGSKKKAVVVEEPEPEEEEEIDEEEVDEEELEDEVDEDEEEDEDEEDEEEEEEEPEPTPKKRVAVTRGRGKKANPSKK